MHTPRISVIIPAYNAAAYIAEAIDSALGQTCKPFEVIIVDDGSTDGTRELLVRYGALPGVRVILAEHQGVSAARNQALRASTGEYVALLDADDRWRPEKLTEQLALFSANPAAVLVCSDMELFGDKKGLYSTFANCTFHRGAVLNALIRENFVPTSSVMIRRSALFDAGLFTTDARITVGEDYHLWLRIASHGEFDFSAKPLVDYRVHVGQSSRNRVKNYASLCRMFRSLLKDPTFVIAGPQRLMVYCRMLTAYGKYFIHRFFLS
jgi:glycosyltransferase involved in cell wall biosynthesis